MDADGSLEDHSLASKQTYQYRRVLDHDGRIIRTTLMRKLILGFSMILMATSVYAANAGKTIKGSVTAPMAGVICDKKANFCADSSGISVALTKEYLGAKAEKKLMDMGSFDTSEFVLSNGVRCDTKAEKCTVSKINLTVDAAHSQALFGK